MRVASDAVTGKLLEISWYLCSVNPDSSFVYVLSKQISVFSSAIVQFRIGVISSYPNVN